MTRACIHADTASFYRIGGKVLSVLLKLYFASPQEFLSLTVSRINGTNMVELGDLSSFHVFGRQTFQQKDIHDGRMPVSNPHSAQFPVIQTTTASVS